MSWEYHYSIFRESYGAAQYKLWCIEKEDFIRAPGCTGPIAFFTQDEAIAYAERLIDQRLERILLCDGKTTS